jgi:hypothetical protein
MKIETSAAHSLMTISSFCTKFAATTTTTTTVAPTTAEAATGVTITSVSNRL